MPANIHGNSNTTPGMVKEALFQRIENVLGDFSNATFFDLCSGSGQIAIEAVSLGFRRVHACELDQGRFKDLLSEVKKENYPIQCHRKDFRKLIPLIFSSRPAIAFLDLPYSFWTPRPELLQTFWTGFLEEASSTEADSPENVAAIFIQGPAPFEFSPSEEVQAGHQAYGTTVLSWAQIRSKGP